MITGLVKRYQPPITNLDHNIQNIDSHMPTTMIPILGVVGSGAVGSNAGMHWRGVEVAERAGGGDDIGGVERWWWWG